MPGSSCGTARAFLASNSVLAICNHGPRGSPSGGSEGLDNLQAFADHLSTSHHTITCTATSSVEETTFLCNCVYLSEGSEIDRPMHQVNRYAPVSLVILNWTTIVTLILTGASTQPPSRLFVRLRGEGFN